MCCVQPYRLTDLHTLAGDDTPRVTGHRTNKNRIFKEDNITVLSRVRRKSAETLKEWEVVQVVHSVCLEDNDIMTLAESRGLSVVQLQQMCTEAKEAALGKY